MADRLAQIFGTEKDKVNCSFYFKIGACRHGDRCSRLHNKPTMSETILLQNMYQNPLAHLRSLPEGFPKPQIDEKELQNHFEEFYEDVFEELGKFGRIRDMQICDNVGDHLVGNVYCQFYKEEDAAEALKAMNGRFYAA